MKFMKSVYSRSLLALILATSAILVTSAEVGAFVPSSAARTSRWGSARAEPVRRPPGSALRKQHYALANLEEPEKIDENEENEDKLEVLRKEMGITDGVFQKSGVQLLAQLDEKNGKKDEGSKACAACPEMVSIPAIKFAIGKYAVTFKEWDACVRRVAVADINPG